MRLIDADELITAFPCGESVRTESVRATIKNMPTIEVVGGDLEDAILLTKDAYSDLCLRASQVSDKAECDNCIWNVCNYNKIDWEVSEDCISRKWLLDKVECGIDNILHCDYDIIHILRDIEDAPSVAIERKRGEWVRVSADKYIQHAYHFYRCSECGEDIIGEHNFCPNCGADNRAKVEPKPKCHRHGIKTEDGTLIYECIGCDEMDCDMRGEE